MSEGSTTFNTFGNNIPQQGMMNVTGTMGGMQQQQPVPVKSTGGDDDFGDFENAVTSAAAVSTSSDPLSKLISLDGLTKNTKKDTVNMLHQPIAATPAAQQYLQYQQNAQTQGLQNLTLNPAMSFRGIDGLNKPMDFGVVPPSNLANGQPVMGGGNVTAGGADMISMMSPIPQQNSSIQQMVQITPQQMGQMTPQQIMFAQQQMMAQQMMAQQMMAQQQMQMQSGMSQNQHGMGMSSSMNVNQMGGMNPQMGQMGGMNPQMGQMGGTNPQMGQTGGMNPQTGQMGGINTHMNQQGMGQQQPFGTSNNMMGGQPMGGWR